jgi:hypothetical protein
MKRKLITFKQFILENQEHTSAGTSQHQVSGGIAHAVKKGLIKPNTVNVDNGGGKYDKGKNHVETHVHGAELHVHDPYNRSKEHNDKVKEKTKGKAHYVGLHNVLNVIKEPEARQKALQDTKSFMKPGGTAHITTYEGDNSGKGRVSKADKGGGSSWQEHRPTSSYVPEVKKVFPDSTHHVELHGKHIIVRQK